MYTELRRIYSENSITLNLEQREFGLISDFIKNNINKVRRKVADKLEESIIKDFNKSSVARGRSEIPGNVNSRVENKLSELAEKKWKSDIIFDNTSNSNMNKISSKDDVIKAALNAGHKPDSEIIKDISKKNYYIIHPSKSGTANLAHEIGHIQNKEGLNPIKRVIRGLADKNPIDQRNPKEILSDSGIILGMKNYVKGSLREVEEKNANKNALKILKKNGFNKNEIEEANDIFKNNQSTYRHDKNIRSKIPIMNKIQVPSKRFKGELIDKYNDIVSGNYKK